MKFIIRCSSSTVLLSTHNVDSSTVELEQSNAEYDITHVVDSSTVELEQSNAEYDITHVVDSVPVLQYCCLQHVLYYIQHWTVLDLQYCCLHYVL
jgi:hypothetical protein